MTEEQIRDAGAQAVANFPPLTDEVAAKVGALLADLDLARAGGGVDAHEEAA